MAEYCETDAKTISTIYDHLDDWGDETNMNTLLNYIPRNSVNFQITSDISKSVRPNGYLHILAKNLTYDEYIPLSNAMKERLVYAFQNHNKLIFCFFNSYDTQPDLQTEKVIYEVPENRQPRVSFKSTGNFSYMYYFVGYVTAKNSFNCYMKTTAVLCPEFLQNFQDTVAASSVYGVGTWGMANGGKRMVLSKNDGTYELLQLNLDSQSKIYAITDLSKFW